MVPISLAVCACTYRRPAGLRALLDGLAKQTFRCMQVDYNIAPRMDVVIADNEGSEEAQRICEEFRDCGTWSSLIYVHEPRRGISFARNACLASLPIDCEYFAIIDDDEVPAEDWLDRLLLAQKTTGADVVQGRVVPQFADGAPVWIANGGFFGRPRRSYDLDLPKLANLQQLDRASTNNVLVRTEAARHLGLQFDPAFALSGGEDTLFFRSLHMQGCWIVYAAQAVVTEAIPAERATFRYMSAERFRVACINASIDRIIGGPSAPVPSMAARLGEGLKHIGLGCRRVWKTALSRKRSTDRFAVGAFQAAHGLGLIAAAFGWRYQHYK